MAIQTSPDGLTTIRALPAGVVTLGPDIRRLDLATNLLTPAPEQWVDPNDQLTIFYASSLAGVNVQTIGRVLAFDGTISNFGGTFTTLADRLIHGISFPLYYGFLLAVTIYTFATPVPVRGQVFVQGTLTRRATGGGILNTGLGFDYLTNVDAINWPYSRNISGTEGPGVLTRVAVTTPAAGAEWSTAVPTGARWLIHGVRERFATSGVAGTRVPALIFKDTVPNTVLVDAAVNGFTPLQANFIDWHPGVSPIFAGGTDQIANLTPGLTLMAGWTIGSQTAALDAGDAYTQINLYVEEWLEA